MRFIFCLLVFALTVGASHADVDMRAWDWRFATKIEQMHFAQNSGFEKDFSASVENSELEYVQLPWHKGARLYRIRGGWEPSALEGYYLYGPDGGYTPLLGVSPPIHAFNKQFPPQISDASTARMYLSFFMFFVRGSEGPFLIFDTPNDFYVPKANTGKDAKFRKVMRVFDRPVRCEKEKADWICDGYVYYSNAVYLVQIKVEADGMVTMLGDEAIAADLPKKIFAPISPAEMTAKAVAAPSTKPSGQRSASSTEERQSSNMPAASRSWVYDDSVDAMTDKRAPKLVGIPVQVQGPDVKPFILFECSRSGGPRVQINWGVPLQARMEDGQNVHMLVTMRYGKSALDKQLWVPSKDRSTTYEMNDIGKAGMGIALSIFSMMSPEAKTYNFSWTAAGIGNRMSGADQLAIRGRSINGIDITAVYDMGGFSEGWSQLKKTCR